MTNIQSETHKKYEELLNLALSKARKEFLDDTDIQLKLNLLDNKISDAIGISFEKYREQQLTDIISEHAKSIGKTYQDFCLEMVLTTSEIEEIKDLEILLVKELT